MGKLLYLIFTRLDITFASDMFGTIHGLALSNTHASSTEGVEVFEESIKTKFILFEGI